MTTPTSDERAVTVTTFKPHVPVPRRLRLRYWWSRRRLSPIARAIADDVARDAERAMLFGDRPCCGDPGDCGEDCSTGR